MRNRWCDAVAVLALVLFEVALASASITGSISGVVTDPSGAVVSSATVVATNTQTGIKTTLTTDGKGFYSFSALPVGTYNIEVRQHGFKAYRQEDLVIDVNSALRADVSLQVGQVSEMVTVSTEAAQVETESTQMGEVISASRMTSGPLDGRAYTDLLSLQPGVVPSAYGNQAPATGKVLNDTNPRHGQPYFNTSLFGKEAIGQIGNANRRFFHGPVIYNFDMALLKGFKFTESKELQMRFEAFIFSITPSSPTRAATFKSGTFGVIGTARDPRIMQVAMKFMF